MNALHRRRKRSIGSPTRVEAARQDVERVGRAPTPRGAAALQHMMSRRFPRQLTVIPGGHDDALREIRLVVDDYLAEAVTELTRAADRGDLDEVRVYAFEVLTIAGTIVAACPRPRRAKPSETTKAP